MCFESAYKLKKKTQIKKVKNVLAPRTEKIISKLSIPSMITNEANISITSNVILTKLFDKRQLSVIRSGLCYSKNKQYIEHENGEVEMFKRNKYERDYDKYLHSINERHIRSNFSSEGPKHLRSPDEIYPHNRISRYELIDDVTYYTNPNKTKKEFNPDLELVIEDKKKSKTNEKVQDQVNQFDTFSSPLKSCSPSDYVNSNYKETNNAVRAKRVTPNSIDQESNSNKNTINRDSVDRNFERYSVPNTTKNTKLELVTILEKYHDRKEMLQEKKLHFLYKDEPIMISGKGKNKYIEEFSDYMRSYEVSDSFTESGNSKKSKGLANIKGKQKGLNTFTRLHKKVMSSDLFPVNGIPLKR